MRRSLLLGCVLALLALPLSVQAATTQVVVGDNFFNPATVSTTVGNSVHWGSSGTSFDFHNVREDSAIFRSGSPMGSVNFTRTFSAGSFHYFCEVHGSPSGGMAGLVKVPVKVTAVPDGPTFTVQWASSTSNTGTLRDVDYRVGSGPWRPWKTDTNTLQAVFGKGGAPVTVVAGTTYSFRARSQVGPSGTPSRLSPARSFVP